MLKISRLSDYASLMMTLMAKGELMSATQLSKDSGIGLASVQKLLKKLAGKGLLRSQAGSRGGYVLSRSPEKISLLDIVVAIDDRVALTVCVDSHCNIAKNCPVRQPWQVVSSYVIKVLQSVSLSELAYQPHLPSLVREFSDEC